MVQRPEAKMCLPEVKAIGARPGLGNVSLMDEKMSTQFVGGCFKEVYLWKMLYCEELWTGVGIET